MTPNLSIPDHIECVETNGHLHTPFSFSAFETIPQALDAARAEGVRVVGINDFNTTDGYWEWYNHCRTRKLYPLFNIEMIGLQAGKQAEGIRINDPANPGRIYLSGKGVTFPTDLPEPYASKLANVRRLSNRHVEMMCMKLNALLDRIGAGFILDFDLIEKKLTRGQTRERHLAKALRMEVYAHFRNIDSEIGRFFEILFGGKPLKSNPDDHASIENEIRANLLKSGGAAFVAENPEAFLPLAEITELVLAAGGIPTYPFLADDAKGAFTDFEGDLPRAMDELRRLGIHSVEFIPTRNSAKVLEEYAACLWSNGFIVTFGTEHNSPVMEPVTVRTRDGQPLTEELRCIGYYGSCVIASHQYRVRNGERGWVDGTGAADTAHLGDYIKHGDAVIKSAIL